MEFTYPHCVVLDVHDGDTAHFDIDQGFGVHQVELRCRVYGINAPELSTAAGVAARDFARSLLPIGSVVTVRSKSWDKYGERYDGQITLPDGRDFGEVMIAEGYAVPYPT